MSVDQAKAFVEKMKADEAFRAKVMAEEDVEARMALIGRKASTAAPRGSAPCGSWGKPSWTAWPEEVGVRTSVNGVIASWGNTCECAPVRGQPYPL